VLNAIAMCLGMIALDRKIVRRLIGSIVGD
jgi:hypothetical protein